jgi:hypothetical protein
MRNEDHFRCLNFTQKLYALRTEAVVGVEPGYPVGIAGRLCL